MFDMVCQKNCECASASVLQQEDIFDVIWCALLRLRRDDFSGGLDICPLRQDQGLLFLVLRLRPETSW